MRTIPNVLGYYNPSAAHNPINAYAFQPDPKRDPDGLSFFRLDFVTAKTVARACRHPAGAYVAMLHVRDLLTIGLNVVPSVIPELPGHVIIPELNYATYKQNKKAIKAKLEHIIEWAKQRKIYGPTEPLISRS